MSFEMSVRLSLTDDFVWDIMTTMVETHYEWFAFKDVRRWPEGHPHYLSVTAFTALEVDCDGDGSTGDKFVVTDVRVVEALQKILQGKYMAPSLAADISRACAENDAGNIDANLADIILQVACFNEVRYG